jgi:hypothetical protein
MLWGVPLRCGRATDSMLGYLRGPSHTCETLVDATGGFRFVARASRERCCIGQQRRTCGTRPVILQHCAETRDLKGGTLMTTSAIRPTIDEIRAFLLGCFRARVRDPDRFSSWIDDLFNDIYGQVLAVSLYIDITGRRVPDDKIVSLLDTITARPDFDSLDARTVFCFALEDESLQQAYPFCHTEGRQSLLQSDRYVRVMPLKGLIEYYLRGPLKLSQSGESEREVIRNFFSDGAKGKFKERLGIVTSVWRGRTANVWVTTEGALAGAVSAVQSGQNLPDVLRDRLGFIGLSRGWLATITYPAGFDSVGFYAPTTLDINSLCAFYISMSSSDGWGLTCGLKTDTAGLQERVHEPLNGLADDFELDLRGEVAQPDEPDPVHLLQEALGRASTG